ncbi:hypothetical protein [Micromonospora violae]|uniref:hypothetical protein n=1 Tax=Micromonospora violae TaxID=1278207 RepID=UPI0033CBA5F7
MPEHGVPIGHRHSIVLSGRLPYRPPRPTEQTTEPRTTAENLDHLAQEQLPVGQLLATAVRFCGVGVPHGWLTGADDTRPIPVEQLVTHLVAEATTPDERDRVWRYIITQARNDSEARTDWNLYALGCASLGLVARAARIAPPGVKTERLIAPQFDLICAFLDRIHARITTTDGRTRWRLNIERPNVFSRLLGGAYDYASGRTERRRTQKSRRQDETEAEYHARIERLKQEQSVEVPVGDDEMLSHLAHEHQAPADPRPSDAEAILDLLNELVARSGTLPPSQRIDPTNAELVRRTYLGGEPLGHVAAELGLSPSNASGRRATAVRQLTRLLAGTARIPAQRRGH